MLIGAVVRIIVFLQNRNLFLDEANLSRNFDEKSFSQLFQNLDYEQYSPPLFSILQKLSMLAFGVSEYALRLVPLLSSLVVLFLFYRLCQHFITHKFLLWFPLFILSFSNIFLKYSTLVKQYMSDTMTALALVLLAVTEDIEQFSWQHFIKWTGIGVVVVWFSMSSVYVLAGLGIYFFILLLKKQDWNSIFRLSLSIACWLLSFGLYYFTILKTDVESDYLSNFHQAFFLPLMPSSAADWSQMAHIFKSILRTTVGYTTLAYAIGIIGIISGFIFTIKNKKIETLLLVLPILFCLGSSTFELYSLMPRLTLFFIPFLMIFITLGWQWIVEQIPKWSKIIVLILLIAVASLHDSYQYLGQYYKVEEIQPIMQYIQKHQQPDDVIFVYHEAVPAFQFYKNNHQDRQQYNFESIILGDYKSIPNRGFFSQNGKLPKRIWLLYSHVVSAQTRESMAQNLKVIRQFAKEVNQVEAEGAYGFLFVPNH